jgi:hypothetical protein
MAPSDDTPARVRWARLRFQIIGALLAAPPDDGELRVRLTELAAKAWTHPTTGYGIRFSFKTVERWFYAARGAADPITVLARKVPKTRAGEWKKPQLLGILEHPREGPAGPRAPRIGTRARSGAAPRGDRPDLRIPRNTRGACRRARAAGCVDRAVRSDGGIRRVGVGDDRSSP